MPALVQPRQWELYNHLRRRGFDMKNAAREANIGYATVRRYEGKRNAITPGRRDAPDELKAPAPIPLGDLRDEAKRALEDFSYFQRRYLGRLATPWQAEAAYAIRDLLESPEKEFVVINAPPGSGKSTTFAHDVLVWLICRNRAVRILMGSKVESAARRYVARVRRTLERTTPYLPEDEEIARGLAVPAEATLADDFGSFKPDNRDLWSAEGFVVAQHGNIAIAEKEPTVSAYGMDSGFLGMRYDAIVWDDLVDKLVMRTAESRENQQEWWDDVAEKRLEPGGLLLLQGQRMGADDLYRYCLDKKVIPDDADEDSASGDWPAKYHHIVFKAHYEDRCEGNHAKDAAYYPDGCLLDPRRLPWRELRGEMSNPRHNFAVIYQQEDTDPDSVLVDPLWVQGGRDPRTGAEYPGCQDRDRDICELPHGLAGTLLSIATADPSPTKYWSCLAKGTLVLTKRGEVRIETVTTDDYVMTRAGWRKVAKAAQTGERRVRSLLLSNGHVLRLTDDHRVLTARGWVEAASLVPWAPSHVLGVGDYDEMCGIDAWRVLADMVDLRASDNRFAVENEHPVCEPVRQPLAVGLSVNNSVPAAAGGEFRARPEPFPAPRGVVDLGPGLKELQVWNYPTFGGDSPVPASNTPDGPVVNNRIPAVTSVHVVSIAADDDGIEPVFDIEVEGDLHEFVAEGVIVHNCQWWIVRVVGGEAEERYLMDHVRQAMDAPSFLDWSNPTQSFVGLMEDWQARSVQLGHPISTWIVEKNGAQRFLLQYEHVRRWKAKWRTDIVPHETEKNKSDPTYGVQTLAGVYKYGLVRLPWKNNTRGKLASMKLVEEVTHWPGWRTDDTVMAQWFLEWRLPQLIPRSKPIPRQERPSWLKNADTWSWKREAAD